MNIILTILVIVLVIFVNKTSPAQITIPEIYVTVTATPTVLQNTVTVTAQSTIAQTNTPFFQDSNAINTLIAEVATILISTGLVTILGLVIKKKNTKLQNERENFRKQQTTNAYLPQYTST